VSLAHIAHIAHALQGLLGSSPLEVAGNLCGLLSVVLAVRESVWTMPTGLVNEALFAVLFYQVRLYPDVLLQALFFALTVYGWYAWTRTAGARTVAPTTRLTARSALTLCGFGAAAYVALGLFFATRTDASLPWVDSFTTVLSVIAQYLLSRKVFETWYLWIAADLILIPLYVYKGIGLTGVLYAVFLLLSIRGLLSWRRELRRERDTGMGAWARPA